MRAINSILFFLLHFSLIAQIAQLSLPNSSLPIREALFESTGRHMITYSATEINRWDIKSGKSLRKISGNGAINVVKISSDGKVVLVACTSLIGTSSINLWDIESGKSLHSIKTVENAKSNYIGFLKDSSVIVEDIKTRKILNKLKIP
jgi:WD40 repeat protein